ncbi:MAG TPA: S46 family peptidase [Crocinitomicaceae bacterium]|nr:S46 family peptidase [Crocinitomicaceae bacterium]
MKKITAIILLFIASTFSSFAEEGMLIPSLISAFEDDMKAMGMKLSADDIYSVNHSSLKDAILHFGGGCTAELVSSQGLLLTNHHCGYSQIQSHSSLENDYLKYGFWAKNKSEEKKNPGLTAARVVRIQDVTASVFQGMEGLSQSEKLLKMQENVNALIKDAMAGNEYSADIKPFNYGNDFYMIVKETFRDVRLVGTPPNSIGKFGGDTDNWVWPRHTGDFSVFRVYANASNEPSDISDSNVPYKPLHFLPVSVKNRVPGEFTMVYGFPGSTEQHLTSENLRYIIDQERPARIKMRDKSLGVINAGMRSSDLIRIQYSSKQARIANGWKKWIGQIGGLKTVDAIQIKLDREKRFNDMAATKPEWQEAYGSVINELNKLVVKYKDADFGYSMAIEYLYVGPEVFKQARNLNKFLKNYEAMEIAGTLDAEIDKQIKGAKGFFKNYDAAVDKEIFLLLTEEYVKQVGNGPLPARLKNTSAQVLADKIFKKSILTDEARFIKFMNKLKAKSFKKLKKKDLGFIVWSESNDNFRENVLPDVRTYRGAKDQLLKTYVKGKMEMFPDDKHWPDANSTMRITYGKLEGSAPHDGMAYTEHTTIDGIIAKNNSDNPDFDVLPRMRELAKKKDYGDYAQDGELWVCFSGSNHTTGGNSGSPVIDAEGNLMGLNFDRTWESTMSDFMFDASRCRNIAVDVRYVLWVMDRYSGAKHLVDEMVLVK